MYKVLFSFCLLLCVACTKEDDLEATTPPPSFLNTNWERVALQANPAVSLPKQDGSGDFYILNDLIALKDLEGYKKDMGGFYTFYEDGRYTFTKPNKEVNTGQFEYRNETIFATNADGKKLEYQVVNSTEDSLEMLLPTIFFGQATTLRIVCIAS